jgi:hypothetical protein
VAQEFIPIGQLLDVIQAELRDAGERLAEQRGQVGFVLGECTVALALELSSDGRRTLARFPSFAQGDGPPPEFVSRVSLTLRPAISLEEPR